VCGSYCVRKQLESVGRYQFQHYTLQADSQYFLCICIINAFPLPLSFIFCVLSIKNRPFITVTFCLYYTIRGKINLTANGVHLSKLVQTTSLFLTSFIQHFTLISKICTNKFKIFFVYKKKSCTHLNIILHCYFIYKILSYDFKQLFIIKFLTLYSL